MPQSLTALAASIGHLLWTFTIPRMRLPFCVRHPDLRGRLRLRAA